MQKNNEPPCVWCGQPTSFNHTIPASILRTAEKKLGRKFGLRSIQAPNRVVQSTGGAFSLCKSCDNSFSPAEHSFREQIYAPLLTGQHEFEYGDWLLKFATSIAWKRLTTGLPQLNNLDADTINKAQTALKHWEGLLRGKTNDPGHYQHHLFLTQHIDKKSVCEAVGILITEVFECTVMPSEIGLWVWTTVPGCILVTFAFPCEQDLWQCASETRIQSKGKFGPIQRIPERVFIEWAKVAEENSREAANQLSPKQRKNFRGFRGT
jgi:hypothetical protein